MLPPVELFRRVLELLPPNDQALSGRLACKLAAQLLDQVHHRTARFSQPLPACFAACNWLQQWREGMRLLTFNGKLHLLSAAASSGSETNLEYAWGLVQPCLFPELLPGALLSSKPFYTTSWDDPGVAAAKAGHAHLLPWLVEHCWPLDPLRTLEAAAQHCDLAGLQTALRTIVPRLAATGDRDKQSLIEGVVEMAGRSLSPGAQEKVAWLFSKAAGLGTVPASGALRDQLLLAAAQGAAAGGNVSLLRWLSGEQGLELAAAGPGDAEGSDGYWVLACAMEAPGVGVAEWLVDEGGCPLPGAEDQGGLEDVWRSAVFSGDVAKLRWLRGRGVPVHGAAVAAAAEQGQLDAVRYLHERCGVALSAELFAAAAGSGSVPLVSWLLDRGCPTSPEAYRAAANNGRVELVVWLAKRDGGWPRGMPQLHLPCLDGDPRRQEDVEAVLGLVASGNEHVWSVLGAHGVLSWAAAGGHLDLVQHIVNERGVAASVYTLVAAVAGGCEAAIELVLELVDDTRQQHPLSPYAVAARRGDRATLECLRRRRVPWGARVMAAVAGMRVQLPVLRWMAEQGAPWDCQAVEEALEMPVERPWSGAVMRYMQRGGYERSREWLERRNRLRYAREEADRRGVLAVGTVVYCTCVFAKWRASVLLRRDQSGSL